MINANQIPVLVGAGQFIDRSNSEDGLTAVEMIGSAMEAAITDTGKEGRLKEFDVLACCGLTVDARQVNTPVSGLVKNVPSAAGRLCGVSARKFVYAEAGGNTPQALVNYYAKAIAKGECESVLLAGGEALHTMNLRFNHWLKAFRPKGKWRDRSGEAPDSFGKPKEGNSPYEGKYQMNLPANVYPLFENALRAHYGHAIQEHQQRIGRLFSQFTKVAEQNAYAWFRTNRSAQQLIEASAENRWVGFPYPKRLNSMILVNQSAAVVLMSLARAQALGIARDRCVFLHGYADGYDVWNVSERLNFHSSPAIEALTSSALTMANTSIDEIGGFDIYSCFPSAVQIACDAMGIAHDDSRGLTLTGGLPYFGGPGNSYSMHAIAEMVAWARNNPNEHGLVNANGWYLTKHAVGIYAATPPERALRIDEPINQSIHPDAPRLDPNAVGEAKIETYTVLYDRKNRPTSAIVIARTPDNRRCLASSTKVSMLNELVHNEGVGRIGQLRRGWRKTTFDL